MGQLMGCPFWFLRRVKASQGIVIAKASILLFLKVTRLPTSPRYIVEPRHGPMFGCLQLQTMLKMVQKQLTFGGHLTNSLGRQRSLQVCGWNIQKSRLDHEHLLYPCIRLTGHLTQSWTMGKQFLPDDRVQSGR